MERSDNSSDLAPKLGPLPQLRLDRSAEVVRLFDASKTVQEMARSHETVPDLIAALREQRQITDAMTVLAHALDKRTAILWAYECVRMGLGEAPLEGDSRALWAVRDWLDQPTEERRRTAHSCAEAHGYDHASSWVAVAVVFSNGSIAPVGGQDVPAHDGLCGLAVTSAILMIAAKAKPQLIPTVHERFLDEGLSFAAH